MCENVKLYCMHPTFFSIRYTNERKIVMEKLTLKKRIQNWIFRRNVEHGIAIIFLLLSIVVKIVVSFWVKYSKKKWLVISSSSKWFWFVFLFRKKKKQEHFKQHNLFFTDDKIIGNLYVQRWNASKQTSARKSRAQKIHATLKKADTFFIN